RKRVLGHACSRTDDARGVGGRGTGQGALQPRRRRTQCTPGSTPCRGSVSPACGGKGTIAPFAGSRRVVWSSVSPLGGDASFDTSRSRRRWAVTEQSYWRGRVTRRRLLAGGGVVGAGLAAAALVGCSSSNNNTAKATTAPTAAGTQARATAAASTLPSAT